MATKLANVPLFICTMGVTVPAVVTPTTERINKRTSTLCIMLLQNEMQDSGNVYMAPIYSLYVKESLNYYLREKTKKQINKNKVFLTSENQKIATNTVMQNAYLFVF